MFSTRDLDISLGQLVDWHGQEGTIRNIEAYSVTLELESGEVIEVDVDELIEQNEDIVICEE